MKAYKLNFIDKLYFWFNEDTDTRQLYLLPRVKKHYDEEFNRIGIRKPIGYNDYIFSIIKRLIFEYEINFLIRR